MSLAYHERLKIMRAPWPVRAWRLINAAAAWPVLLVFDCALWAIRWGTWADLRRESGRIWE